MNYLPFLLFSKFLLLHGAQILVEIKPNWKNLPEYRSLLEPEEFREVFQSKRFELQIFKEGIQEGISIAGIRLAKDRDVFLFENIPVDWMEPTGVVLEIKLPPILMVKKILQSEESFYYPRIRRPFRIFRNRNDLLIYNFFILENPKRIFRNEDLLPMGETPKGGNEVAYMESLNNSLTKLEQSEQLCAQTKYECNLNLLLKQTHVERQFVAFLRAVPKQKLTVTAQNFATIKAKSDKLFTDIMKLAIVVLEEEKKLFKENASSSIDLHYPTPTIPTLHLHSQHQHEPDLPQSSRSHQTPTSGASSSAAVGVLPTNRKIIFKLMPIELIAQVLAGLHILRSSQSQPSQINIPAGTNQERMKSIMSDFPILNSGSGQFAHFQFGQQQQQPEAGLTSHGPSASLPKKEGKKKKKEPTDEARAIGNREAEILWRHFVKFEDIWTRDPTVPIEGRVLVNRTAEEQRERFKLTHLLGIKKSQIYNWLNNKKNRLKTQEKTRREFESEKRKYQSEMAAAAGVKGSSAGASASKVAQPNVNEKTSNAEVISSSDENDPNPMANAQDNQNKTGQKRKHSSEIVPLEEEEEDKMQEDD